MTAAPYDEFRARVLPEWIDDNQHLNAGYYDVVFDHATDAWLRHVGLDTPHRARFEVTTFTVESHTCFLREVHEGARLRFETLLLGHDEKRIHYIHAMHHEAEGYLAATNEVMTLVVSRKTRRATAMQPAIQARLAELLEVHAAAPRPAQAGRRIGLDQRR